MSRFELPKNDQHKRTNFHFIIASIVLSKIPKVLHFHESVRKQKSKTMSK